MGFSYGYNRAERDRRLQDRPRVHPGADATWSAAAATCCWTSAPTATARSRCIMEQRLLEIGDWLKVNGEAIYGTRYRRPPLPVERRASGPGSKFGEYMVKYNLHGAGRPEAQGRRWPSSRRSSRRSPTRSTPSRPAGRASNWSCATCSVPADAAVTMLGVPGTLQSTIDGNTLTITTPDLGPDEAPCRHAYAFKIPGGELQPGK